MSRRVLFETPTLNLPRREDNMTTTYKTLAPNLHLVQQMVGGGPKVTVAKAVNHLAVIDCSGSMSWELPRIRDQLKKRLPHLLGEGDTFSLIWFSGRGEHGVLIDAEHIATLKDLSKVNQAIDRWLRPVGLTGFKEPLQKALDLAKKLEATKNPVALFFMSDGQHNDGGTRQEVLAVTEQLAGRILSSTFVEYGMYADRRLLTAMAQAAGGKHVFADSFDKYAPAFEQALQQKLVGTQRVQVTITAEPIGGFVFAMQPNAVLDQSQFEPGDLVTFEAKASDMTHDSGMHVEVNANLYEVYYLTDKAPPKAQQLVWSSDDGREHRLTSAAYAALSLFAARMQPEIVYPLLQVTGDVRFINAASGLFGKQKYTTFMQETKAAAFDTGQRLVNGYDPSRVPPEDVYTVFDLLHTLSADDGTRLLLDHPLFRYSRVSRARVDASENLTVAERERVEQLQAEAVDLKLGDARLATINQQIADIMATKQEALKFEAEPALEGYEIASLTYNEKRPNISVLVKKFGTVDLSARLNDEKTPAVVREQLYNSGAIQNLENKFKTFIYRNYTIVVDGLVNVEKLVVRISRTIFETLVKATNDRGVQMVGVAVPDGGDHFITTLDLSNLPILNRKMVIGMQKPTLRETIEREYKLTRLRAHAKVFKAVVAEKYPGEKLVGWTQLYGAEAAEWLKTQGITEFNGFNPKMTVAESVDFITGKELDIKLKGYSTLPKVEDVRTKVKQIADGKGKTTSNIKPVKLNGPESLMAEAIREVDAFLASKPEKLRKDWLTGKQKALIAETRGEIYEMARVKFAIIVGQVWFADCATLDDKTLSDVVMPDGTKVTGTAELSEIQIKI